MHSFCTKTLRIDTKDVDIRAKYYIIYTSIEADHDNDDTRRRKIYHLMHTSNCGQFKKIFISFGKSIHIQKCIRISIVPCQRKFTKIGRFFQFSSEYKAYGLKVLNAANTKFRFLNISELRQKFFKDQHKLIMLQSFNSDLSTEMVNFKKLKLLNFDDVISRCYTPLEEEDDTMTALVERVKEFYSKIWLEYGNL